MKTIMQLCVAVIGVVVSIGAAHAVIPGAYAGAGVGVSRLDTTNNRMFALNSNASHDIGGTSGRVFAGYHLSQYLGFEMGYTSYASSIYKGEYDASSSSIKYSMNAVDVIGKAYMPLSDSRFNVYALGGMAEVFNTTQYNNGSVPLANGVTAPENGSHTYHKLRPKYGVGVTYDLTSHVSTSVEFSRIHGTGNMMTSNGAVPNADMMSLSVTYKFS